MAQKCLSGCSEKYKNGELKRAIDAQSIAPWVKVTFTGSGGKITVGNQSSSTYNHRAVISNFQYGCSDGSGVKIEIIDEEGGAFQKFFNKLFLNAKEANEKTCKVSCTWGWIKTYHDGSSEVIKCEKEHNFIIMQVEVKIEQTFKFTFEATDMITANSDSVKNQGVYGGDSKYNKMSLKEAIENLAKDNGMEVKFWKVPKSGSKTPETWEFKDDYKWKWVTLGKPCLEVIKMWTSYYTTKDDKGIRVAFDDTQKNVIILWEDASPGPKESSNASQRSIGTFIVNGSDCSPVLQFTPRIKWATGILAQSGGVTNAKTTAESNKLNDISESGKMKTKNDNTTLGITNNIVVTEDQINNYGKEAAKEAYKADVKNLKANSNSLFTSIDADLVIQGDPSLDDPIKMAFAYASIIVINPYRLNEDKNKLDWVPATSLATSSCNAVLSNGSWQVQGCSHEIHPGSYTTTLKLFLPAPGSYIDEDQSLGGDTNGYELGED